VIVDSRLCDLCFLLSAMERKCIEEGGGLAGMEKVCNTEGVDGKQEQMGMTAGEQQTRK